MITRNRILFAIGIWTVLLPLLGFPSSYETFFTIASGLIVSVLAFLYARDKRMVDIHDDGSTHGHETVTSVYTENRPKPSELPEDEKYTDLKSIISRSKNF